MQESYERDHVEVVDNRSINDDESTKSIFKRNPPPRKKVVLIVLAVSKYVKQKEATPLQKSLEKGNVEAKKEPVNANVDLNQPPFYAPPPRKSFLFNVLAPRNIKIESKPVEQQQRPPLGIFIV